MGFDTYCYVLAIYALIAVSAGLLITCGKVLSRAICKHKFHSSDWICIDEYLDDYKDIAFDDSTKYKLGLVDYRVICPCRKCGKVAHASCAINLPGSLVMD